MRLAMGEQNAHLPGTAPRVSRHAVGEETNDTNVMFFVETGVGDALWSDDANQSSADGEGDTNAAVMDGEADVGPRRTGLWRRSSWSVIDRRVTFHVGRALIAWATFERSSGLNVVEPCTASLTP